ncbi:acetyltransferase [Hymenobacter sedentarius]|uniref:Acetyltransferase n=1 Tax=Hymenobacter sedentarius TaxID=1411621 RepID=A0A0U3SLK9_9BACT|nr:ACT domain-containing protein [Hymenobacter sedentarius]ALW87046.1 acetyltransferase [Hymenobacter sedentarius]
MAGETNLQRLLTAMQPVLNAGEYVFCTTQAATAVPADRVLGSFREAEGLTLIVARETADAHGLSYDYVSAWLTLNVHSSLAAVGLTAAVATALSRENISCNVVAAYFHDHLFVAQADAQRALAVLQALTAEAGGNPSKKAAD